jgi:hypothetical protein
MSEPIKVGDLVMVVQAVRLCPVGATKRRRFRASLRWMAPETSRESWPLRYLPITYPAGTLRTFKADGDRGAFRGSSAFLRPPNWKERGTFFPSGHQRRLLPDEDSPLHRQATRRSLPHRSRESRTGIPQETI